MRRTRMSNAGEPKFTTSDLDLRVVADFSIRDEDGCRRFFQYLVEPLGLIWHPDTRFKDYVVLDTGGPVFTPIAAAVLDHAMAKCFELLGERVYDVGLEETHKWEDANAKAEE
jgi:hypothetical protein